MQVDLLCARLTPRICQEDLLHAKRTPIRFSWRIHMFLWSLYKMNVRVSFDPESIGFRASFKELVLPLKPDFKHFPWILCGLSVRQTPWVMSSELYSQVCTDPIRTTTCRKRALNLPFLFSQLEMAPRSSYLPQWGTYMYCMGTYMFLYWCK